MTTDQELRARLAEAISNLHPLDGAEAILDDIVLLDDLAEFRARQINAEADVVAELGRPPRRWDSVYNIPHGVKFWPEWSGDGSVTLPKVIWERFTHDTCRIPGALLVEGSRELDARYPNGFSEVVE